MHANYEILAVSDRYVTLRDLGPWDSFPTVTNDVEYVVRDLYEKEILKKGVKLYYHDSEGGFDEILHRGGVFRGFRTVKEKP